MTLHLTGQSAEQIREHGAATYSHECCGALIGTEDRSDGDDPVAVHVTVARVERLENTHEDNPRRRFLIDPMALARLEHQLEGSEHQIVGFYHSHPDHEARPSTFDREHAWPGLSYVVLAVAKGRAREMTSWRLAADRSVFHAEPLIVHGPGSSAPGPREPRP